MRPQQNRRIRGRGNNNNNGNNRRAPNPLSRNYESNGPDVKIRGNAQHIADKYAALARDVQAAGDRIMAENYLQHAEHYMRIILSAQPQFVPPQQGESVYEETQTSNIVDLPLLEPGEIQENSLQLIVNREAEEALDGEDEVVDKEEVESASPLPVVKPKMERPRRITRRRLPRPVPTQAEETAAPAVVENLVVAKQAPSLPIHEPSVAAIEVKQSEEDVAEKPRRRRRAKAASEEAVAQ